MSEQYTYPVKAVWEGGRKGTVSAEGITPSIRFSSPPEFKGDAGFWTPEHFLVAAVASCYVATFYAMANNSKMEFRRLELEVEGKLGKPQGKLRFTGMVLRPKLELLRHEDRDRAIRLLEKAEQGCLIAHSLVCPVSVEPAIHDEEEIMAS